MDPALQEGIRLFNAREFFEAHEALEALWLKSSGDEKIFLHGLIQVAAAFHHFTCGNLAGFRSLLEKGSTKLEKCSDGCHGIRPVGFLTQLLPWREWAEWTAQHEAGSAEAVKARRLPRLPMIRF